MKYRMISGFAIMVRTGSSWTVRTWFANETGPHPDYFLLIPFRSVVAFRSITGKTIPADYREICYMISTTDSPPVERGIDGIPGHHHLK